MKRFTTSLWSSLAVGGVLLGSVALQAAGPQSANSTRPTAPQPPMGSHSQGANDRLMVHSDGSDHITPVAPEPLASNATSQSSEGVARCPSCPDSSGVEAYYGSSYYDSGNCQQGCRPGCGCRLLHRILDWTNPHGMCVHSPDYGFRPPVKQPIYRRPVAYTQWYPQQGMSGQQVGYNQYGQAQQSGYQPQSVYWPTDTTQMGYYYQHVPQWHPYQGMVPGTPVPQQWHQYPNPSAYGNGHHRCQVLGTVETIAPYGSQQGPMYQQSTPTPEYALPEPTEVPAELVPPVAPSPITPMEATLQPTVNPGLLPLSR